MHKFSCTLGRNMVFQANNLFSGMYHNFILCVILCGKMMITLRNNYLLLYLSKRVILPYRNYFNLAVPLALRWRPTLANNSTFDVLSSVKNGRQVLINCMPSCRANWLNNRFTTIVFSFTETCRRWRPLYYTRYCYTSRLIMCFHLLH